MRLLQSRWLLTLSLILLVGCGQIDPQGAVDNSASGHDRLSMTDGLALEAMDQADPILDAIGDGNLDMDFDTVRVQVQDGRLLLRVRLNKEINVQGDPAFKLLIDNDSDATSGIADGHQGAEIVWTFGKREGLMLFGDLTIEFGQGELGIITAPTVTTDFAEIAIPLDAVVQGYRVFPNDIAGVAFVYEGGDRIPDEGFAQVDLTQDAGEPETLSIAKTDPNAVRFMEWNVYHDGIVERPEVFHPVFDALQPDIVILVEVWETKAEEAQLLFNEWLPLGEGRSWYAAKYGNADVIALSRWPILDGWKIPKSRAAAFLLEMPDPWQHPLFVIGAHTPCCHENEQRQEEIDAFMAFLRDARQGTGPVTLEPGTHVVISGDMNLVEYDEQLITLVEGRIVNELWGPSFGPDSDGTMLTDLFPRHLTDNLVYTWRKDNSTWGPGKLDYIVYSDADIVISHSFVLDTRLLPEDLLLKINLRRDVNVEASDHLPVVADLLPR